MADDCMQSAVPCSSNCATLRNCLTLPLANQNNVASRLFRRHQWHCHYGNESKDYRQVILIFNEQVPHSLLPVIVPSAQTTTSAQTVLPKWHHWSDFLWMNFLAVVNKKVWTSSHCQLCWKTRFVSIALWIFNNAFLFTLPGNLFRWWRRWLQRLQWRSIWKAVQATLGFVQSRKWYFFNKKSCKTLSQFVVL